MPPAEVEKLQTSSRFLQPGRRSVGKLFGTDGVRGIVNESMTPELAMKVAQAACTWLGGGKVLVGRDVRYGGDMLVKAVIAGLASCGCEPYYAGLVPTPALQYAVPRLGYDMGIMVTASHNPPPYNGVKVVGANGVEVPREEEKKIEEIFFTERFSKVSFSSVPESKVEPRVLDVYVDGILAEVDKEKVRSKGFKVVVDGANSVGSLATPRVLRELGVKVLCVNCNLDPSFPGRQPEPTPETLKDSAEIVKAVGADLLVAHDADADRAILGDERGEVHWGDRSGSLLTAYVSRKYPHLPKRTFTGVSSSHIVVEGYLRPKGIEVVWTPVGSVIIAHELIKKGGISGFEENGGYMHPVHHPVRDGAMKAALFLEMMATEGRTASELFDELPKAYSVKGKVPKPSNANLEKLYEQLKSKYENCTHTTIDGLKVVCEDYWFLVRPSGTEPVIRIMVEATDVKKAKELYEQLKNLAESLLSSL